VWLVELDPVEGHEQAGRRPALVLSVDAFNASPAELVTVLPITSKVRALRRAPAFERAISVFRGRGVTPDGPVGAASC
jgi:mRNA-degrading endonuclease toxin of MazEF toxin-antitoxin module